MSCSGHFYWKYVCDGIIFVSKINTQLYDAENGDDRLLIVIQGLKGLDLPEKYAQLFSEKGYSTLAMSYYGGEDMTGMPEGISGFDSIAEAIEG